MHSIRGVKKFCGIHEDLEATPQIELKLSINKNGKTSIHSSEVIYYQERKTVSFYIKKEENPSIRATSDQRITRDFPCKFK